MENKEVSVEIVTNKIYFIEDDMNISFKFINKSLKPKYSDWIALYKCSSNRNLEEFVAVETDLKIHTPTKYGFYQVKFYANQLKNVKCNVPYEFLYGNEFNEIYGISHHIRFIHQNECIYCYPDNSELETNHCSSCVSPELINSLLSHISILDSQLTDCKVKSNEIISLNKRLMAQMNENEIIVQKNNEFLDDLFYSNEPVTRDGYWIETCTDIDLKMSCIESNEYELQDLSNQHYDFKKALEKCTNKEDNEVNDVQPPNTDTDKMLDCTVNVESVFTPEPSTATIVFIDSDEDDV
ncbi:uncharacterized protein LOC113549140 isoform X2 [Rhopalosiphum maidis]|uniref:uncharacterized protein LOC113549140 isoform X2 n=1 Tax=Rhopalosiphum maidis TaxID=43146 RepID=UPI000F0007C1|nr:uncharacterized protein LOC113549140 isoform X2 [Rhopalosiphum maidis]